MAARIEALFLSAAEIDSVLGIDDVLEATEETYRAVAQGRVQCPPKTSLTLPDNGQEHQSWINSLPAEWRDEGIVGVKWSNVNSANPSRGLPSTMATILLNDSRTGAPLAVLDATRITAMRSGAQLAVGARHLARGDSTRLAVLGAGRLARTSLKALARVLPLRSVRVWSRTEASVREFIREQAGSLDAEFAACSSPEEAAREADVVVLATAARRTVLRFGWAKPGAYVAGLSALADLDPAYVERADKYLFDHNASAVKRVREVLGLALDEARLGPDICRVAAGLSPGRERDEEIIAFTPVGLGAIDIRVALAAYRRARERGLGRALEYLTAA